MTPQEAVAAIFIAVSTSAAIILRGPIGRAFAERGARKTDPDPEITGQIERLNAELEDVKHRLAETEDRLDFAERLLAKQRPTGSRWSDWEFWISRQEAAHYNLALCLRRLGRSEEAELQQARFRTLSEYLNTVRRLRVAINLRPHETPLQKRLAELHRRAGFPELASRGAG